MAKQQLQQRPVAPVDILPFRTVQPAAQPVDTYHRPQPKAVDGNMLSALGNALSAIQPGLNVYFAKRHNEQTEEDVRRGMAARGANKLAFDEAVRQGLILPTENPWFRKGYSKQTGLDAGNEYELLLRESYDRNVDGVKQMDAGQYGDWVGVMRQRFLENRDSSNLDFMDGFRQNMGGAENHALRERRNDQNREMLRSAGETLGRRIVSAVDRAVERGANWLDAAGNATDADEVGLSESSQKMIGAEVTGILRDTMALGFSGTDANLNGAVYLTQIAERYGADNPLLADAIFESAKYVETGGGNNLAGIAEFVEMRSNAQTRISNKWLRDDDRRNKIEAREIREKSDTFWRDVNPRVAANPFADFSAELATANEISPQLYQNFQGYIQQARQQHEKENLSEFARLSARQAARDGGYSRDDVLRMIASGDVTHAEGQEMLKQLDRNELFDTVLKSADYRHYYVGLMRKLGGIASNDGEDYEFNFGSPKPPIGPREFRRAQEEWREEVEQWLETHVPDGKIVPANRKSFQQFLAETEDRLTNKFRPDMPGPDVSGAREEVRARDAAKTEGGGAADATKPVPAVVPWEQQESPERALRAAKQKDSAVRRVKDLDRELRTLKDNRLSKGRYVRDSIGGLSWVAISQDERFLNEEAIRERTLQREAIAMHYPEELAEYAPLDAAFRGEAPLRANWKAYRMFPDAAAIDRFKKNGDAVKKLSELYQLDNDGMDEFFAVQTRMVDAQVKKK